MSYRATIDGLTRLGYEPDGTGASSSWRRFEGLAGNGTQICSGVSCPGPDDIEATFSLPIDPINFFHDADYFVVYMVIDGPSVRGAECKEASGVDTPCQILAGEAYYDATIDPDGWLRTEAGTWVSVPGEFDADNTDDHNVFAHTTWPRQWPYEHHIARLVNPVPVWPLPDGEGNEYGGLHLFTLAQLPVAIEITITTWNYHQSGLGRMLVGVTPYMEGDVDPGGADEDLHIIGSA